MQILAPKSRPPLNFSEQLLMLNLVSESSYWAIFLNEFFRRNRQCRKDEGGFYFSFGGQKIPIRMPIRNIRTNEWFDTSSIIDD